MHLYGLDDTFYVLEPPEITWVGPSIDRQSS
jgi:hypothetical protein